MMAGQRYYVPMGLLCTALLAGAIGCSPQPTVHDRPQTKVYEVPERVNYKTCHRNGKPAVIAIIDTGFRFTKSSENAKLCRFGHKDFTKLNKLSNGPNKNTVDGVPTDEHGHGTNIAGLIQENAGDAEFCMVILKYWSPQEINGDTGANSVRAIEYATRIGAKYINYSGGGMDYSPNEAAAVRKFLNQGGTLIAAAGNERKDSSVFPYYPAGVDPRTVTVGSLEEDNTLSIYSNYGSKIDRYEYGTNQVGFGISMSGTSQATAIASGKIIYHNECEK